MEIIETVWERFPAEWRVWLIVGAAVLLGVEAISTAIPMSGRAKRLAAFLLGPGVGMALYALGQVDVPLHGDTTGPDGGFAPHFDGAYHVAGAALGGLAGTLAAALAHDYGGGKLLEKVSERLIGRTSTPAAPAAGGGA